MLLNKTKNDKIMENVRVADTHWKRMKGLMFEDAKNFDYALVFELDRESRKMASVHMMFVFFTIDVLFLNNEKKVVDVIRELKPFTPNYTPKKRCRYFVEMPAGKTKNVSMGDTLEW